MIRRRRVTLAALCLELLLSACAGLHMAGKAPPSATPPAVPAADGSGTPPAAEPSAGSVAVDDQTASAAPASTACSCGETKPRPKPKVVKPKPVIHKPPPAQLPTAPIVADTPPGGVIDAQVKTMSVSVMSILGKRVRGPSGEDLGRVVDVLADASGRVRIAIIDFGGFLGVGNHRIAVEWPLLRFNPDGADPSLLLSLSLEKLRAAPEYKDNARPQTLMEPPTPVLAPVAPR